MPFVVRRAGGGYLRRVPGCGRCQRSWVDDINEATVWSKAGYAKTAAHLAPNAGAVEVVEVRLTIERIDHARTPPKSR